MRITTHPGEVLREEFMAPLSLTADALAMAMQVPATRIGEIVDEQRGIDADTALRLARYFGTTPEFWLNLQSDRELSISANYDRTEVERDIHPRMF